MPAQLGSCAGIALSAAGSTRPRVGPPRPAIPRGRAPSAGLRRQHTCVPSPRDHGRPPPRPDGPRQADGPRPHRGLPLWRGRRGRRHPRRPPDGTVVRHAGTVAKAHAADADSAALALRVAVAAGLPGILLPRSARRPPPCTTGSSPTGPTAPPWTPGTRRPHRGRPRPPSSPASTGPRPTAVPPMRDPRRPPAPSPCSGPPPRTIPPPPPSWTPGTPSRMARGEAPLPNAVTLCHGDFHLASSCATPRPPDPGC